MLKCGTRHDLLQVSSWTTATRAVSNALESSKVITRRKDDSTYVPYVPKDRGNRPVTTRGFSPVP